MLLSKHAISQKYKDENIIRSRESDKFEQV